MTSHHRDDFADKVRDAMLREVRRLRPARPRRNHSYPPPGEGRPRRSGLLHWAAALLIAAGAVLIAFVAKKIAGGDGEFPRIFSPGGPRRGTFVYAQQRVLVHERPDGRSQVVRTLDPGDEAWLGARGPSTWYEVLDRSGDRLGYSFRTRRNLLPVRPKLPPPRDTTALCGDSSASFSAHASGTCSGHGGVLCWVAFPGGQNAHPSRPSCPAVLTGEAEDP
jgi:hypothetical protein